MSSLHSYKIIAFKTLKVSPEKSQILSCDTEQYVYRHLTFILSLFVHGADGGREVPECAAYMKTLSCVRLLDCLCIEY